MDRLNQYALNLKKDSRVKPLVIVLTVGHIQGVELANKLKIDASYPYLFSIPSYPWASECYILTKESIDAHLLGKLNIVTAIGVFLTEQKTHIAELNCKNDPNIKLLQQNLVFGNTGFGVLGRLDTIFWSPK